MRLIDADAFKNYIRGALDDVKHLYKDNGAWAKEITDSFCMDIDEQPTVEAEPRWTPCSERLPELRKSHSIFSRDTDVESDDILICTDRRNVYEGRLVNGSMWVLQCGIVLDNEEVIAWRPLPEPYRGGDE